MYKKSLVFDFDGVINSYKSGWQGEDVINDPPVEGIDESIRILRHEGYKVYVVSTRCRSDKGKEAVINYLSKYMIFVDGVFAEKPPAIAYIDDRAICFDGNASTLVDKVKNFKTWIEKEKEMAEHHVEAEADCGENITYIEVTDKMTPEEAVGKYYELREEKNKKMRENKKFSIKGYDYLKNIVEGYYFDSHKNNNGYESDFIIDEGRLFFRPNLSFNHPLYGVIFALYCSTEFLPAKEGKKRIAQTLYINVKNITSGYEETFKFRLEDLEKVVTIECSEGSSDVYVTEFDTEHPSVLELSPYEIVKNEFETIFERLKGLILG